MMKNYEVKILEETLECLASCRYPLYDTIYCIKRVGKTYIEIGEYP